jgi:hypothetical protein
MEIRNSGKETEGKDFTKKETAKEPLYWTGSRTGLSLGSVLSHSSTMEVESPPPTPNIQR